MINLDKGGQLDFDKASDAGALTKVVLGLGWDPRPANEGDKFDLDASIITLGAGGHSFAEKWFVFYNNLASPDAVITHSGDSLDGGGEGDDEQITIDLTRVPAEAAKLVLAVTIHKAAERKQHFGMVHNAYVRIVDASTDTELARYNLSENGENLDTFIFGEVDRVGDSWVFTALGDGSNLHIDGLVEKYKIG